MTEDKFETINIIDNLTDEERKEMAERVLSSFRQFANVGKIMAEQFSNAQKTVAKSFEPIFKVIKKVKENNEASKVVRGHIVTTAIDLDDLLEDVITKYFIIEEKKDKFLQNVLSLEHVSSYLKYKIVKSIEPFSSDSEFKRKVQLIYEIRNVCAHSKYVPTFNGVFLEISEDIYKKTQTYDIEELKSIVDEAFEVVKTKIENFLE